MHIGRIYLSKEVEILAQNSQDQILGSQPYLCLTNQTLEHVNHAEITLITFQRSRNKTTVS